MKRNEMIRELKGVSPVVTAVTGTFDMGYEFSAIVSGGVIYPTPGMLLDYSNGEWPPSQWQDKDKKEYGALLSDFLSSGWETTPWKELSNEELEQWLFDVSALGDSPL